LTTAFFVGYMGQANVFGHFETDINAGNGKDKLLARLPYYVNEVNTVFTVQVVGGSCGNEVLLKFRLSAAAVTYFRLGVQAGWQQLSGITIVKGVLPANKVPNWVWCGQGGSANMVGSSPQTKATR